MKYKHCISLFFLLLSLSACSKRQVDQNKDSASIKEEITNSYILIPIQDEANEVRTSFTVGNDKASTKALYIRLAVTKIDYWVKYDVKAFKGKEIQISFEGV